METKIKIGIRLILMIVSILLILPFGIMARELLKVSNNEGKIQEISSLAAIPNLNQVENNDQQIVVIYADRSDANVNALSLTASQDISGEQVSEHVDVLEISENINVDEFMTELENKPNVLAVNKNSNIEVSALPNDPYINDGSAWQFNKIGAGETWDNVSDTDAIVIAVIDTGINTSHPDLIGKTVRGYDYVENKEEVVDLAGHGTAVSGCIGAAANNGIGIAGVTGLSNIKIAPYRTGGSYFGDTQLNGAYICAGIMDAADRPEVKVINMSFGGYDEYPTIKAAVEYAANEGKILVSSSGNEGKETSIHAGQYSYPGSYDHVISVGATDINDRIASFSQNNDKVDLCAPGEAILTTSNDGSYKLASGTSFASPIVAGSCAVVLAADPNLTPAQVENILKDTALDLGNSGKDNSYGNGMVQLDAAVESIVPILPINLESLVVDKPSNQEVNTGIQLSATASGGKGPYEYKFYYQLRDSTVVINDFSSNSSVVFTPTEAGIYTLFADVKDTDGNVATKNISDYVIMAKVEKPSANYGSGTINKGSQLILFASTEGAIIYYTTDGTDPTIEGTRKIYTEPIPINEDMNFRITAYKDGAAYSEELGIDLMVAVILLGDVDANGKVQAFDALIALQIATGKKVGTPEEIKAADVGITGDVEAFDALRILQFTTGKITEF